MAAVLVHNNAHGSEGEARKARRTRAEVRDDFYWNIWRRALSPFNLLADGVDVLLLESWPGGGIVSWHVQAEDVIVKRVTGKAEAVRLITRQTGLTRREVMINGYTQDKPDDATVLIYWTARPVKRLNIAKPPALKVRRNGWLVTDDAALSRLGVRLDGQGSQAKKPTKAAASRRGQGRRLDVEAKRAVEVHAETLAEAWCRRQGWSNIQFVGSTKSWDIEGTDRRGRLRYVEVKGTTGQFADVEVTSGEVESARTHGNSHLIFIVHGVTLDFVGKVWKTSGGTAVIYAPWKPKDGELTVVRYRWKPAPTSRPV